ncbi:hypothetical protein [Chitinophaga sp. MM2321]|uniref:hypothetical protein n=1 Tax=Chitinophaga sp. MM2321 TaxID=3137178 RepID=UPI0032D5873F
MKLKFNFLVCLLLPLVMQARNRDLTYKKTITKEFTVNAGATFNISNKYGKVIFHTWNKNEIKATITITGFGKKDEEAQSIADMVNIVTEQSSSTVVGLRTLYNPSKSGSSWFSWGGKMDSKDYVNVDYDIYVPQSLQRLRVENQFGDVIADKFTFPAELILNYCTYDIREAQDLEFKVNYCDKGKIGKAGKVRMKSNYSSLRGEQLEALETRSNYSDYTIASVGVVSISSNYDDYKLERVSGISGRCTYTDVKMDELQQELDMRMTYGDVVIKKIGTGFKGADFQLTYADAKISAPRRQPMQLEVSLINGELRTGGLELKNVISNKVSSVLNYTAQAGGGSEQSPRLKVKGTNSSVKLDAY